MNLQEVIDDLKKKAAEYHVKALDPRESEEWRERYLCNKGVLLERATRYEEILAEEEKAKEQQFATFEAMEHKMLREEGE